MSLGKDGMNLQERCEAAQRLIAAVFDSLKIEDAGIDLLTDLLLMRMLFAGLDEKDFREFMTPLNERFLKLKNFYDNEKEEE